jgi:branched-chain amino acid transport system ATP-binding protein
MTESPPTGPIPLDPARAALSRTQAPALAVDHLTAGYGATTVLWDVSLEVPSASVVALLGPNGAGKTTLLRAASGLIPAAEGRVVLGGRDMTGKGMHEMAREGLCHVPEGRGVFPSLSVKENLTLFSPKKGESAALERAAATFPILGKRMRQTAGSLSGGEQQMLAIVRAYISNPRLVLVDEASLGLAPLVIDQLFEFLGRVSREGAALLLVEQYVYRALELADRVYLLNHGRIVYAGTPSDLEGEDIFERYLGIEAEAAL